MSVGAVPYTTLLVDDSGVRWAEQHERRFVPGGPVAVAAFRAFAADVAPGVYAVRWEPGGLVVETRPASRLRDGIPVRYLSSPFASVRGRFPKPPPPAYREVRMPGVVTLLTDPTGREIYEACVATVIAWNGRNWVVPPADRPRVDSVAEAVLRDALPVVEAPIPVGSDWPLALINAVVGVCFPLSPGRRDVSTSVKEELEAVLSMPS